MSEPKTCVQYHEYIRILVKIQYDDSLPLHNSLIASQLRKSIENTHYKHCVTEYNN